MSDSAKTKKSIVANELIKQTPSGAQKISELCLKESEGWTHFKCRVSPQASKTTLTGFYGDALKISIKAPPVDGKANEELIRFLSKSLKISKSFIVIVSGETSKTKTIKCKTDRILIENFIKQMEMARSKDEK